MPFDEVMSGVGMSVTSIGAKFTMFRAAGVYVEQPEFKAVDGVYLRNVPDSSFWNDLGYGGAQPSHKDGAREGAYSLVIPVEEAGCDLYVWPDGLGGERVKVHVPYMSVILFRGNVLHAGAEYGKDSRRIHVYILPQA